MRRPTFSILVDSEENTNLALKQLIEIALEEGIITEEDLKEIELKKAQSVKHNGSDKIINNV